MGLVLALKTVAECGQTYLGCAEQVGGWTETARAHTTSAPVLLRALGGVPTSPAFLPTTQAPDLALNTCSGPYPFPKPPA